MLEVVLAPGREKALRRRHPWVLSGAVAEVRGDAAPGAWARVLSARGEPLGWGDFAPGSQIRVRMLAFGPDAPGEGLAADRVAAAVARRTGDPLLAETDAVRLVNAEGDGLPGLVVDRYADVLVARPSTAAMGARLPALAELLRRATGARAACVRPDPQAARREGLSSEPSLLFGDAPDAPVEIRERGRVYRVDVRGGQKTGFYLDQRDARDVVERIATGRRVLDLFCYSGGFTVAALRGGATRVTAVDSSQPALDLLAENLFLQAPDTKARARDVQPLRGDAFAFVRESRERFDLLVLDPPPLARRRGDVSRATRAYKDLLLHALGRAAPGARLLFFACSHHIDADLLAKTVFAASLDARRPVRWLGTLSAPPDHPVSADHPEGRYLTGALLEAE